jgi:hypothetical protein
MNVPRLTTLTALTNSTERAYFINYLIYSYNSWFLLGWRKEHGCSYSIPSPRILL